MIWKTMLLKILCIFLATAVGFLFIGIQNLLGKNEALEQENKNLKKRINNLLREEAFKVGR